MLERDSNPWPLRYRCSALPIELPSQLGAGHCVNSLYTRWAPTKLTHAISTLWKAERKLGRVCKLLRGAGVGRWPIFLAPPPPTQRTLIRIPFCSLGTLQGCTHSYKPRWRQFNRGVRTSKIPRKNRGTGNSLEACPNFSVPNCWNGNYRSIYAKRPFPCCCLLGPSLRNHVCFWSTIQIATLERGLEKEAFHLTRKVFQPKTWRLNVKCPGVRISIWNQFFLKLKESPQ